MGGGVTFFQGTHVVGQNFYQKEYQRNCSHGLNLKDLLNWSMSYDSSHIENSQASSDFARKYPRYPRQPLVLQLDAIQL